MNSQSISGWVNPLTFIEADETLSSLMKTRPTPESILQFLCPADELLDIEKILARYREVNTEPVKLFLAPAEQRILDKLVWPLRHAKASFMVGNYLATISLSGMVAEMVTMLLWEMASPEINDHPMTKDNEKKLFGSDFEKLGQERRVSVLSGYDLINHKTLQHFETIRLTRKRYLHLWSQDHDRLANDAVTCYHAAVSLVVEAIGQDIRDGKLALNPKLLVYLERKGQYNPSESDESDTAG